MIPVERDHILEESIAELEVDHRRHSTSPGAWLAAWKGPACPLQSASLAHAAGTGPPLSSGLFFPLFLFPLCKACRIIHLGPARLFNSDPSVPNKTPEKSQLAISILRYKIPIRPGSFDLKFLEKRPRKSFSKVPVLY